MNDNYCILAQGGGMVTAYHVGVVKALKEKYSLQNLNRIIANSGAAATYTYLVSNQEHIMEPIWIELVRSGKFVTPWEHPLGKHVINIDFLVDEMMKKKYPLDLNALKNSRIELNIGVTNSETGESIYISKDKTNNYLTYITQVASVTSQSIKKQK